jgi:hypothetical protein
VKRKKFILMIGDDGAVLVLMNGDKVERRLFAISASLSNRMEFNSTFINFPDVPIRISIDVMEQSYTKQTLPAVSSRSIGKLVKKRLDRDFSATDIKGAVFLSRNTDGRRDWEYLFLSCPLTSSVSEWVDYILSLENRLEGIYMLPIEMQNLVITLNKNLIKLKPQEQTKEWQFFVTANKTGGYRQVVLHKDKVIFTRLVRAVRDTVVDILAGNIEQEIINTVDYMRRLGFSDNNQISISAVLPKDLAKSMRDSKINGLTINIYTPFSIATILGIKDAAREEDKFFDIVMAASFAKCKPVLTLDNPKIKKINDMFMLNAVVNACIFLMMTFFVISSAYLSYNLVSMNKDIKELELNKVAIEKKWKDATKNDDLGIDVATKITNVYKLHKELSVTIEPLELVKKIIVPNVKNALVSSFSWNYSDESNADALAGDAKKIENAEFSMDFNNVGGSIDDLFVNFEKFNKAVKDLSVGYDVEITELPETITFDENNKSIPIKIKIKTLVGNNTPVGSN